MEGGPVAGTPPKRLVRRDFGLALLLAVAQFGLHILVIFEAAKWILGADAWLVEHLGRALAAKVIIFACFAVLFGLHFMEAVAWGLFLWHQRLSANLTEAIYFSAASVTGLGYGDVVLASPWRLLGPVMAITGLLMFGCSTAFLIVVIQKVWDHVL